ncbi:MAG: hypothetical protein ACQES5_11620 [Thermodesulfobacteriota bacterium]
MSDIQSLDWLNAWSREIPFSGSDCTAGVENEFQVVVEGGSGDVDLPRTIKSSRFYRNIRRRSDRGDTSDRLVHGLDEYLRDNPDQIWENSWVVFRRELLRGYADSLFTHDLKKDKNDPSSPLRFDSGDFFYEEKGAEMVRIPVSYLLKLTLADIIGSGKVPESVRKVLAGFMDNFQNDNTSPEVISFYPAALNSGDSPGEGAARETAQRFLFCQLLVAYANNRFGLEESGQKVVVYCAPHSPVRQKMLNAVISDSYYRKLFMNPCLSGWDRGEEKRAYMGLCHEVLSRSQLNTIPKLKECGIITRNLVVLPNTSNTSLANNGVHISLGSRALNDMMRDPSSGFGPKREKYQGDLAIKIIEHFLPLFAGTYSGSPYRMDFKDFHPELALGYLPHELDFTHLRMIWRRWKKKASLNFFGHRLTPFGPEALDRLISRVFGLKGDYIQDFRLIDYFVALMSTRQSPGLDGSPGNDQRLKKDLETLGVFHGGMSAYQLYKLREFGQMGFSGFEGRYYSQFFSLAEGMGEASALQALLTSLAFKYIIQGKISHADIPDHPSVESERRQIFFGTAIGIPTFYVHKKSTNRFLRGLILETPSIRSSRRYQGYWRVYNKEFRLILVGRILGDAPELVEKNGMESVLQELKHMIRDPRRSASGRLCAEICRKCGTAAPMRLSGDEFNTAAEEYYRNDLREKYSSEGFSFLWKDLKRFEDRAEFWNIMGGQQHGPSEYLHFMEKKFLGGELLIEEIIKLVSLLGYAAGKNAGQAMEKNFDTCGFMSGYDCAPAMHETRTVADAARG